MPVFKKINKYDIFNYRLISLLPQIKKNQEKIIVSRLTNFHNNIITKSQYGFKSNNSTVHADANNISSELVKKKFVMRIFVICNEHLTL